MSFFVPLLVARREATGISPGLVPLGSRAARAPEGGTEETRRWQSSVEISARARPDPSLGPHRPAGRRGGGPRPVFARPRPPPARQVARPQRVRWLGTAQLSAPLLLSTAAESSGDEASDHTASRFGDAESAAATLGSGRRLGQRTRPHPGWPCPRCPGCAASKASRPSEEDPQVPAGRPEGHDHGVRRARQQRGLSRTSPASLGAWCSNRHICASAWSHPEAAP